MKPRKLFCKDCKEIIGFAVVGTTKTQEKHMKTFPDHTNFSEVEVEEV